VREKFIEFQNTKVEIMSSETHKKRNEWTLINYVTTAHSLTHVYLEGIKR
jgi:hypothetical protein